MTSPAGRPPSTTRRGLLLAMGVVCVLLTAGVRWSLSAHREFDPDEFQHLHSAWCIAQGQVPYRDFYEHHMPLLPMLLAATSPVGTAGMDPHALRRALGAARVQMWGWTLIIVLLTWALGSRLTGTPEGGVVAAILLSFSIVFTGKAIEIRPDGPATACSLVSLLLLTGVLGQSPVRRWRYFGSGVAFGMALLFTQKLLMAGPGIAALFLWLWTRDGTRHASSRGVEVAIAAAGTATPLVAIFLWFHARGAGGALVTSTLGQNLGWVRETSAGTTLAWLATRDPMLMALGLLGLACVWGRVRTGSQASRTAAVAIVSVSLSMGLGLFLIPTPYPQYLLPVLPFLAVSAADLLIRAAHAGWRTSAAWAVAAAFAFCLAWARPTFMGAWAYPATLVALLLLAASLSGQRPIVALVTVVLATIPYQAQQLRWMAGLDNQRQAAAMELVQRLTAGEHAAVLDGFTGYGWFRPHAWRYHFLHAGVRARLTDADRRELANGLRSGRIAPGVVLFDANLGKVSAEVDSAIRDRFRPTGTPPVWAPRP